MSLRDVVISTAPSLVRLSTTNWVREMDEKEIAEAYGMTEEQYITLRKKIVEIHNHLQNNPNILQVDVYKHIEHQADSTKEAIMITSAICAITWGVI
jgi:hypothetical protein